MFEKGLQLLAVYRVRASKNFAPQRELQLVNPRYRVLNSLFMFFIYLLLLFSPFFAN